MIEITQGVPFWTTIVRISHGMLPNVSFGRISLKNNPKRGLQSTKLNDWSKITKNELHGTGPSSVVPFWRYNINTLKKLA